MKKFLFLFLAIIFFPAISLAEEEKEAEKLEDIVVTGTREAESAKEVPQTVGAVKGEEIKELKPSHPKEALNRVPGVWITSTAGEGHITAIRQPLTTNPVYLYLEDGIPVRSTGFFNHNALYEVNLPGADRIEVTKGPGSALYGSDAIGGTINVMTRPASLTPEIELNPEIGEYGWYRILFSASNTWGNHGFRLDLNDTHSDGWRESTEYDRQSVTFRYDYTKDAATSVKTVMAYSHIDAEEAASNLSESDFEQRPWYDYATFNHRKVDAFRISFDIEKEVYEGKGLISVIPYYRDNEMDLFPGWGIFTTISKGKSYYYGYHSETKFQSFGLLTKYRHDFEPMKARLIFGIDMDYSPGEYYERRIQATRDSKSLKYTNYDYVSSTTNNYDYDATFTGVSPYVHVEVSPLEKLRLTLGARYDDMEYDYDTHLSANSNRPESTEKSFSHLSPKIGLNYTFTKDISAFLAYNNGFRVPSAGDLFKGNNGTASTSVDLDPIKIDSYETGIKTNWFNNILVFDASVYLMQKEDDIVSYKPTSATTQRLNAGETEHKGIEVALGIRPIKEVGFDVAYSYAKHTYEEYRVSSTVDYSGNEMPQAPRTIVNTRLYYAPQILNGGKLELEWVKLGKYWLDDANTEKYDGHDLLNVRASYKFNKSWEIYARGINVTDEDYAERASKSSGSTAQYASGQPQTFYAGITYHWGSK